MAEPVTLQSMIQSVRKRANIENQTGLIQDPEITDYLNAGLSALYDLLVQAGGQSWYRNTYTFKTVGNQSSYALPIDFYELSSVDIALSSDNSSFISARPYMEFERNRYRFFPGWTSTTPVFYRMLGGNINFIPNPSGVYAITLNYYPAFTHLVNAGDTFDGVNGWEEYAIWKAVADCKGKEEEDPSYAISKCAELERKIQSMSEQRDIGSAERMTEVDDCSYGWGGGLGSIR